MHIKQFIGNLHILKKLDSMPQEDFDALLGHDDATSADIVAKDLIALSEFVLKK